MRSLITIFLLLSCSLLNAQSLSDFEKAAKLHSQVVSGERKFENLTPNEQQQVLSIQQLFANSCGKLHGKCKDVCEAANELKSAADDLSNCAKRHDYSNDCRSKFRETKYKFETYESAVSDASGDCS
ncbi:hypothetical protein [Methylophilus sp. DW102]|uniref:hypothetical protein n=1 Tax=Methylophilus sp. DW102 TaxID=3095607 RepID=UPI0030891D56|nr:hypothetical protein MTDW_10520 [Methylophilus sp. DW102]